MGYGLSSSGITVQPQGFESSLPATSTYGESTCSEASQARTYLEQHMAAWLHGVKTIIVLQVVVLQPWDAMGHGHIV